MWKLCVVLVVSAGLSCASTRGYHSDPNDISSPIIYGTNRGSREPIKPDSVALYATQPCSVELVQSAYRVLHAGGGNSGLAMYYYRCKQSYVTYIEARNKLYFGDPDKIKSRRSKPKQ